MTGTWHVVLANDDYLAAWAVLFGNRRCGLDLWKEFRSLLLRKLECPVAKDKSFFAAGHPPNTAYLCPDVYGRFARVNKLDDRRCQR